MNILHRIWRKLTKKGKGNAHNRSKEKPQKSKSKRISSLDAEEDEEYFYSNEAADAWTGDDFAPNDYVDDMELGEEAYTLNLREEIKKMGKNQASMHANMPTSGQHDPSYHPPDAGFDGPQSFIQNQMPLPYSYVDPLSFSAMQTIPANTGMHPAPVSFSYFGLTDLERLQFKNCIASGISDADAFYIIQSNRLMHQATVIPPLQGAIDEERRRLDRIHFESRMAANPPCSSVAPREFERSQIVKPSPICVSRPISVNLTRNITRTACSNMSGLDVEKANQDALQAGIALSIQESNRSPRSICHHSSPAAFQLGCSVPSQKPIEIRPARIVSYSRSKSCDSSQFSLQKNIQDHELVPNSVSTSHAIKQQFDSAPQYAENRFHLPLPVNSNTVSNSTVGIPMYYGDNNSHHYPIVSKSQSSESYEDYRFRQHCSLSIDSNSFDCDHRSGDTVFRVPC